MKNKSNYQYTKYKEKIFRILILTSIILIILQIILIPPQKPYFDIALLNNNNKLTNSYTVQNNKTTIYPYVRNVWKKVMLIKLQIVGSNNTNFNYETYNLTCNKQLVWVILPDKPAKSENFNSNWEITPWKVNITKYYNFIGIKLYYFDNTWIYYDYVYARLSIVTDYS